MARDAERLWGLSKAGTVFVAVVVIAFLGFVVSEEMVQAPIAARKLEELTREEASIQPPAGAKLLECRRTSAPRKAMVACVYSLTDTTEGVGPYYDRALARTGWSRCTWANGGVAPAEDRQYCRDTLRVLLDQEISTTGTVTGYHLDFYWGLTLGSYLDAGLGAVLPPSSASTPPCRTSARSAGT